LKADSYPLAARIESAYRNSRQIIFETDIENFMQQKHNVLVIVGAGHLVGPNSVVNILQQKGYKVEQK
jgi:hypothetical protein